MFEAIKYSLIITFFGVLCLNISSNIAANSIILSNLSVLTKSISSYRKELIRSSIKLDLSKVPVTTSLIISYIDF